MAEPIGSVEIVTGAVRLGLGDPALAVSNQKLLAGGAMHDSWGATAGGADLVVRLSPPARDDFERSRAEFAALKVMYERGVRVPKPIHVGENERGQSFMVISRVPGDSNPRQLLTAPQLAACREQILVDLAECLAVVHTVRPEEVGVTLRSPQESEDALLFELHYQMAEYDRVKQSPHPVVEWALRWITRRLADLTPRTRPLHVVHGDFRIGNMMYDDKGLTASIDWEGVHIGEPEDDLAWFCTRVWRFNRKDLPAGGIATREAWFAAYEKAAGYTVDRERLRLWEVFHNIRWSVICMMQSKQHLDGTMDSHEHAAIGRRAADTELEILRLTGVVG